MKKNKRMLIIALSCFCLVLFLLPFLQGKPLKEGDNSNRRININRICVGKYGSWDLTKDEFIIELSDGSFMLINTKEDKSIFYQANLEDWGIEGKIYNGMALLHTYIDNYSS